MSRAPAMTARRVELLRLVAQQPGITTAAASRVLGWAAGGEMLAFARMRYVHADLMQQAGGRAQRGYVITEDGRRALRGPAPVGEFPAARQAPATGDSYTCPELGRTCHRPGAYDAFGLPSLMQGRRVWPRAIA